MRSASSASTSSAIRWEASLRRRWRCKCQTRISSLAFLCTFVKGSDGSKVTLPMLATALRMRIGTRAMRRNAFLELIMPARYLQQIDRAALAARLHPLFGHDLAEQPPIVMKQLSAMSKYDAGARLAALASIPTLVVSATEDRIARAGERPGACRSHSWSELHRDCRRRSRPAHPPCGRDERAAGGALHEGRTGVRLERRRVALPCAI